MSRKLSQVITDENYFEFVIPIGKSIVEYIVRGLQEKYTARFSVKMEPNFLMENLLCISMFFDTQRNRLYVNYRLDYERGVSLRTYDTELYNRVYDYAQSQLVNDYDIGLTFIGEPTDNDPKKSMGREYQGNEMSNLYLRNDTQFMWTIKTEPNGNPYTYFVQNRSMLEDDLRKRLVKDSRREETIIEHGEEKIIYVPITPKDIMPEYNADVIDINNRYDFWNKDVSYLAAFREYQNVYNEYFNRIPEIIPEWKAFTIYIDVDHNFAEEAMDYEYHPYGKFSNPDETEHYIAKWGFDHGRYVPQEILDKWGIR